MIIDEDTLVMDRKACDNEYFHRAFHSSMNRGIHYLGENYGLEEVEAFLRMYANDVYALVLAKIEKQGLAAIEENIRDTYAKEKALDVLKTELTDSMLVVAVSECPAVKHLKAIGSAVSPWYRYTTQTVMEALAEKAGAAFVLDAYDEKTGAAQYRFVL